MKLFKRHKRLPYDPHKMIIRIYTGGNMEHPIICCSLADLALIVHYGNYINEHSLIHLMGEPIGGKQYDITMEKIQ